MKLGRFFATKDLCFMLEYVFGRTEPSRLIEICREAGEKFEFPMFQASIGQGTSPTTLGAIHYAGINNRHVITWFKNQFNKEERTVIGTEIGQPLSTYYLGLWYAYGWKKADVDARNLLSRLGSIGQVQVKNNWAWVNIEPGSNFNLGAFYAVFGK